MSWPPEQCTDEHIAWTLQAERQAAHPKLRYRLVRVTTTYTAEPT